MLQAYDTTLRHTTSVFSYQLNPLGAPPLSVVKTMTELSYNPVLFRALVMLPTDSSNDATMAA